MKRTLIMIAVVVALTLSLTGCIQSTAWIDVTNNLEYDYTIEVDGDTAYLAPYSYVIMEVEWFGFWSTTVEVNIWDGGVGGYLEYSEDVSLDNGDTWYIWN